MLIKLVEDERDKEHARICAERQAQIPVSSKREAVESSSVKQVQIPGIAPAPSRQKSKANTSKKPGARKDSALDGLKAGTKITQQKQKKPAPKYPRDLIVLDPSVSLQSFLDLADIAEEKERIRLAAPSPKKAPFSTIPYTYAWFQRFYAQVERLEKAKRGKGKKNESHVSQMRKILRSVFSNRLSSDFIAL
jgi:hypothetical protein